LFGLCSLGILTDGNCLNTVLTNKAIRAEKFISTIMDEKSTFYLNSFNDIYTLSTNIN